MNSSISAIFTIFFWFISVQLNYCSETKLHDAYKLLHRRLADLNGGVRATSKLIKIFMLYPFIADSAQWLSEVLIHWDLWILHNPWLIIKNASCFSYIYPALASHINWVYIHCSFIPCTTCRSPLSASLFQFGQNSSIIESPDLEIIARAPCFLFNFNIISTGMFLLTF